MLIKIVTAAVLLAHGIGHVMAPQAAFLPPGAFPRTATAAVGGMTITSGVGRLMAVVWIVPLLGFLAGTYGLWTGADWWRPVLAAAAVVSIAVVLPWWNVMPAFSYIGAIAVDLITLVAIYTPLGDQLLRSFR